MRESPILCLVLGDSGVGKSRSIKGLDPAKTFVIKTWPKPFPFKAEGYSALSKENPTGNVDMTDDLGRVLNLIRAISERRWEIENIVIDDFQYLMSLDFFDKAKEKGFDKFIELGQKVIVILENLTRLRPDLNIYILSHSIQDDDGVNRMMLLGKMLKEKAKIEGMFTIALHALKIDGKHVFLTQGTESHLAKSPENMFDELYIENDLGFVDSKIREMYE